ncbi:hypothetical protein H8S90_03625 [Olivibacter sp. SDN3]|uniref:hypothetical protein n=1 Tax=Olivibacter sp. SDN3 TaxID=2764720 RepID=UPI0016512AF4|nr:hypothetical protein [Olivibacter sp. SDN3]QNL50699.1 hypothetical protein H8S90_03625 [Olivibacter sp. SDN3]
MEQRSTSLQKFNKILADPSLAEQEDMQAYLARFPYSHPLWLLEAKRQTLLQTDNEEPAIMRKAVLFCKEPERLYGYIHTPPINDVQAEHQYEAVSKLDQVLGQQLADKAEDDTLTEEISAADYVPEQEKMLKEDFPAPIIEIAHTESSSKGTTEEVSKYHDELMPYSFVWWLHKTRLDYADTYQPYATKRKPSLKRLKDHVNDVVLDQQIRENIFHLQSPEDKLSVKEESKTVTFNVSHKTEHIIDRFIKEEPQIKPPSANKITLENKARRSAEDQSTFVSETLAQIYVEQGLYHKAIDTYMKLSLKYPKKSVYFADRIKDLESKIN